MLNDISAYLEAAWAAEEYNRHSSNPIMLPFSMIDIEIMLKKIDLSLSVEILGDVVIYENITVKEYAESSVQKCFQDQHNIESINKKRELIEKELSETSSAFLLQQTA